MTLIVCELIVVVCFCLVEFSFASFFLGPGVTLFFPYKELLNHRHRTQKSNNDLKYLEEAQLDIIVYTINCIMGLKSAQNTNGVLN